MLHSPTRAFFPIREDRISGKLEEKRNVFTLKEEDQIQQLPSKVPPTQGCWTKAVVQGERISFSLNYTSTPLRGSTGTAAPATSSCQASAENHSQRSHVFIVHHEDQSQQKITMICFEHKQDVSCGKNLPLYFSVLGHFPYSSGLFPPWGLCHRCHRSYHCNPGLSGIQKPSSHCTAAPGAEPAHRGSGFYLKKEHATVTVFTSWSHWRGSRALLHRIKPNLPSRELLQRTGHRGTVWFREWFNRNIH